MSDGDVPVKIEDQEEVAGYQPPPQKSIAEILAADEDDESLRKYKAALLGSEAEPIVVGEFIPGTFFFVRNIFESSRPLTL